MSVGDTLRFDLSMGPKGYEAVNIIRGEMAGTSVVGSLTDIRDGWGFASCNEVPGQTVLVGKKNLQAAQVDLSTMAVGDTLKFALSMGPKGYEAINITH